MNPQLLNKLKKQLEKEKQKITKQLRSFAKPDERPKGDWDTIYPQMGSRKLEEKADEVEEYESLLPVEYTLELRLKDIEKALEKIKKGTYGICENCKKEIEIKRLLACPEAKYCIKCQQQKSFPQE